jgi:hypothetical protein
MCYGEIISDRMQKARKAHKCVSCHHTIMPGERHNVVVQKDGGDLLHGRWHLRCAAKEQAIMAEADFDDVCDYDSESSREAAKAVGWRKILAGARKRLAGMLAPASPSAAKLTPGGGE